MTEIERPDAIEAPTEPAPTKGQNALELAADLYAAAVSHDEKKIALSAVAAAEEAKFRRASVERQLELRSRGQIFGFVITLLWLVGAVVIGIYTNPWAATLFGSVDLVPLVAIFVLSRQPPKKDDARDPQQGSGESTA